MNLHHVWLMLAVSALSPAYSTIITADNDSTTAGAITVSSATSSSSSATTTSLNLRSGHASEARSAAATTDADDGARSHLRRLTKVNNISLTLKGSCHQT